MRTHRVAKRKSTFEQNAYKKNQTIDAERVTAVRGVKGNGATQQRAGKQMSLRTGFKRPGAARDDVGDDAGGKRDHVSDQAGRHEAEHAERDGAGVALEVRHQAEQIRPRRGRFLRGSLGSVRGGRFCFRAHRKVDFGVPDIVGASSKKLS